MSKSEFLRQSWRFAVVGTGNTLVTVALLALLSLVIDAALAYTVVYVLGLAFTTVMTNRYVFSTARSWSRMAMFVAWYLGVYVIGLGVVQALDGGHRWAPLPLALATVAITAPLSFVGGRLIFASGARPPAVQEISR